MLNKKIIYLVLICIGVFLASCQTSRHGYTRGQSRAKRSCNCHSYLQIPDIQQIKSIN